MRAPHAAFRDAVAAKLEHVAPTAVDERGRNEFARAPRYAWITTGADDATARKPAINGGTSVFTGTDSYAWVVEIWGTDEEAAWIMRLALITAIRDVTDARGYRLGGARVVQPPVADDGYALEQTISVELLAPEVTLPTEPLPTHPESGLPDVAAGVAAKVVEDTEIEGVDFDDDGQSSSGDGLLHGRE